MAHCIRSCYDSNSGRFYAAGIDYEVDPKSPIYSKRNFDIADKKAVSVANEGKLPGKPLKSSGPPDTGKDF